MKLGVIADIHSNKFALQTVLEYLEDKIDALICAGDFVGYGPQPQECIKIFKDFPLPNYLCLGNHDLGVRDSYNRVHSQQNKTDFNILKTFRFRKAAAEMLELNARKLHQEESKFLENLQFKLLFQIGQKKIYLTHGTPSVRKSENFGRYLLPPPLQELEIIKRRIEKVKGAKYSDIIIIGHTHQRFLLQLDNSVSWSLIGDILEKNPIDFPHTISFKSSRIILNPGSVGQPRDGSGNSSFAILDLDTNSIDFHDLAYPKEEFLKLTLKKCVIGVQDESFWANKFGHFSRSSKMLQK
ncbi:MAG: metallophosphoesterase family protein [Promethearchaeota archaeon]